MGLDITVHKLKKISKEDMNWNFFRLINDAGEDDIQKFPEWSHKFISKYTEDWYDWNKFKEEKGIDVNDYFWGGVYYGDSKGILTLKHKETEESINLDIYKIPTYKKEIPIIGYDKVGYQRKGFNGNFYKDYEEGKIGYFVWTKNELERYLNDYCEEDYKEHFKEWIIYKFVEGECCVTFDW